MVGVMPRYRLMLVKYDRIIGVYGNPIEVANYFGISIDQQGYVIFNGEKVTPKYRLEGNSWNYSDAIQDWCKCYLRKHLPSEYAIYKVIVEI